MDAKKLKPYTFWIVSGVVVVIELGLLAFWPIEDESGATPEVVKQKLDTEFKKLQSLHKRADHAPSGVYDAEKPEDIKRLTEEYLLTPQWKGVLQPHVDKYNQQLTAIKKNLDGRSAVLHESIAESSDLFAWYTAYSKKTKDVMLALQKRSSFAWPSVSSVIAAPSAKADGTSLRQLLPSSNRLAITCA